MNVPNLFLIGAPKAGTTSIAHGLAQHPNIYMPSAKEPRFFDAHVFYDYQEDYPFNSIDDYLMLYSEPKKNASFFLDASVFTMYSSESINKILKVSPSAKFLLVLRDPLAASKSMFSQRMKTFYSHLREVNDDFYECWKLIEQRKFGNEFPKGCRNKILFRYDSLYSYEKYVPSLKRTLGDNLMIVSYEYFVRCPDDFYRRVFEFLRVDSSFFPEAKHLNKSLVIKNNFLSKFVYFIAEKTLNIRKKLGVSGESFDFIKRLILKKEVISIKSDFVKDDEIREYFADAYRLLNSLRP